jgi:hypothetical protein
VGKPGRLGADTNGGGLGGDASRVRSSAKVVYVSPMRGLDDAGRGCNWAKRWCREQIRGARPSGGLDNECPRGYKLARSDGRNGNSASSALFFAGEDTQMACAEFRDARAVLFTLAILTTGCRPWPMFHHDLNHTGQSQFDTSADTGVLK